MNYDEFLNCAKQFFQGKSGEIDLRNSASRAYYYLFHKIRETFRGHPKADFKNGKGDHEEALKFLLRINQPTLADRFHECLTRRQNADYGINDPFAEICADEQLKEVQSIASHLESLATGQP